MYIPESLRNIQKPKRKTAKQHVREERERIKALVLSALRDKKRTIPKDWERGFNAAMTAVEVLFDDQ